jgi:hypothetical protein
MASDSRARESALEADLERLGDRLDDEKFCRDLYRALADRTWRSSDGPEGHVALSWKRAEELINDVRKRRSKPPLTLAQTGGEGEVSSTVGAELGALGWSSSRLNTSRHDDEHLDSQADQPPKGTGERLAGDPHTRAWEADAHEAAAENRMRPAPEDVGGHAGRGGTA